MYGQKKLKKEHENWISHLIICLDVVNLLGKNINMIKQSVKRLRTLVKTDE